MRNWLPCCQRMNPPILIVISKRRSWVNLFWSPGLPCRTVRPALMTYLPAQARAMVDPTRLQNASPAICGRCAINNSSSRALVHFCQHRVSVSTTRAASKTLVQICSAAPYQPARPGRRVQVRAKFASFPESRTLECRRVESRPRRAEGCGKSDSIGLEFQVS